MITTELEHIAKRAGVKIQYQNNNIVIKHFFNIKDPSNIGLAILLLGGIFLIYMGLSKPGELIYKGIFIVLGLFMAVGSLVSIISQLTDRIILGPCGITIIQRLKRAHWTFTIDMDLQMSIESLTIKRSLSPVQSTFCIVRHHLIANKTKHSAFTFQMKDADRAGAEKLGTTISALISDRLAAYKLLGSNTEVIESTIKLAKQIHD